MPKPGFPPHRFDPIDRAHLTGRSAPTPPIHRYPVAPDLVDLARRFWIPVWDLQGDPQVQRVLQYPVCLVVVAHDYARFYGVASGVSSVTLTGRGWAVGVMLQPAAGGLLLGASVTSVTDRSIVLDEVAGLDGARLRDEVHACMAVDPDAPASHMCAIGRVEGHLRRFLPVDATDRLVNDIVAHVEDTPDLMRVADLAAAFEMSPRHLQRLTSTRLGLSPKWLIQRRRLHEATQRLKERDDLARLAHELGYTDQAHFTSDYRRVTGMTPGVYRDDQDA